MNEHRGNVVLSEVPRGIRMSSYFRRLDARTAQVMALEPVACSTCGAAHFFVTVRRVAGGWTVSCVGCDREGADARGREALERIKLEATLDVTSRLKN